MSEIKKWLKLVFFLYLFIFSIELIKKTSLFLAPNIKLFISEGITPLKSLCIGWFSTSIAQSSGAVGSLAATFAGNDLISLKTAVFILMGAAVGRSITALIISLVIAAKKRRDFRHGFEIGLCYSIYNILIVSVAFLLEYFFGIFSYLSLLISNKLTGNIEVFGFPDLIGSITSPIINFLIERNHKLFLLIVGFGILIFALEYIGKSAIACLGGEEKTRIFMNRHFKSKYRTYFLGVITTAVVFSSSITVGLLVPLAVARVINLKKAIPFILGAELGTVTDLIIASLIVGKPAALAVALSYVLFSILGALMFLPNTNSLFKLTKYTSKKIMHISRKKALYLLIAFILIPLAIIFIL